MVNILPKINFCLWKVDGHQKQNEGEDNFKRIKMDIEDLYLGMLCNILRLLLCHLGILKNNN